MSSIFDNAGQVVFASGVIGPLFTGGIELQISIVIVYASTTSIVLWIISLLFARMSE